MFNMTALALRTSGAVNGVSQLHGEVTKQMWQPIWPDRRPTTCRWTTSPTASTCRPGSSSEMSRLLEKHLGADWLDRHDDPALGDRVLLIPDEELWAARQTLRAFLFNFIRERVRTRWTVEGGPRAARSWPPARCSTPTR